MDLLIEHGKNTPKIIGDSVNGVLKIVGSSFPENVQKFYAPINSWLETIKTSSSKIIIDCKFYYMASSSVIALLKTLKYAENIYQAENISIKWRYEEDDDDIRKIGEDFTHLLKSAIEFIEEEEED